MQGGRLRNPPLHSFNIALVGANRHRTKHFLRWHFPVVVVVMVMIVVVVVFTLGEESIFKRQRNPVRRVFSCPFPQLLLLGQGFAVGQAAFDENALQGRGPMIVVGIPAVWVTPVLGGFDLLTKHLHPFTLRHESLLNQNIANRKELRLKNVAKWIILTFA